MKTTILSVAILLTYSLGFSQQLYYALPSSSNQHSVKVIENVSNLPAEVISIEREESKTIVKYQNGSKESFDLSQEADLEKFMKIFEVEQIDGIPNAADSGIRILSPLSSGQEIRVIRSDNGETTIDVIPEEIVKDRKQLLRWLKRYNLTFGE